MGTCKKTQIYINILNVEECLKTIKEESVPKPDYISVKTNIKIRKVAPNKNNKTTQ